MKNKRRPTTNTHLYHLYLYVIKFYFNTRIHVLCCSCTLRKSYITYINTLVTLDAHSKKLHTCIQQHDLSGLCCQRQLADRFRCSCPIWELSVNVQDCRKRWTAKKKQDSIPKRQFCWKFSRNKTGIILVRFLGSWHVRRTNWLFNDFPVSCSPYDYCRNWWTVDELVDAAALHL